MSKTSNLDMFYSLADVQGIQVLVNTRTSASSPSPSVTNVYGRVPSPTPAIKASSFDPGVYQLVGATTTLTMGEPTAPLVLTKRVRKEEQQSPRSKCSPNRTHITESDLFGVLNPFINISYTFSS